MAGVPGLFHPVEERIHDPVVARQREDQRDVDADRLGQAGGDRRKPLARGRDLDEQVRPVDRPPQCPRLGDGGPGVVSEPRVDLDRHPPVHAARRVVDRAEDIARPAHVERGQRPQPLARLDAAGRQVTQLRLVRAALGDRPGEDCRVRRYPGDVIVRHQVSQAARGQPVAAQVVQPDRYARLGQRRQWVGHAGLLPRLAAAARTSWPRQHRSCPRHRPDAAIRTLQLPFRSGRRAPPGSLHEPLPRERPVIRARRARRQDMTSTRDDGIRDSSPERPAPVGVLAGWFGLAPRTLAGQAAPTSVRPLPRVRPAGKLQSHAPSLNRAPVAGFLSVRAGRRG